MADGFDEDRETSNLDAYGRTMKATVDAVVADLRSKGVQGDAIDGLVHDAADNLSPDASGWASGINNEGMERQVAFVLQENGDADGREMLAKAADEWLADNAPRPA